MHDEIPTILSKFTAENVGLILFGPPGRFDCAPGIEMISDVFGMSSEMMERKRRISAIRQESFSHPLMQAEGRQAGSAWTASPLGGA